MSKLKCFGLLFRSLPPAQSSFAQSQHQSAALAYLTGVEGKLRLSKKVTFVYGEVAADSGSLFKAGFRLISLLSIKFSLLAELFAKPLYGFFPLMNQRKIPAHV